MAENTQTPEAPQPAEEKTSRWKNVTTKHPKLARVAGITTVALAAVGSLAVVNAFRKGDDTSEAGTAEGHYTSTTETHQVTEA